jgi:hypothetical protein
MDSMVVSETIPLHEVGRVIAISGNQQQVFVLGCIHRRFSGAFRVQGESLEDGESIRDDGVEGWNGISIQACVAASDRAGQRSDKIGVIGMPNSYNVAFPPFYHWESRCSCTQFLAPL